ncbi:MAG: chemotaxis protein CheD [SAR324 cluster bacterium]|nr:chemotaxis protein CheD [SAR324 cluster bacterium]
MSIHRAMAELKRITVTISDMKASADRNSYLITHSLGSCIGLVAYDPKVMVGALLHFQLPDSGNHGRRAQENPFMFADTGIPLFLRKLYSLGAHKDRMVFGMFGGANMLDDEELFKIGIKNTRATKKILWQQSISVRHEDVGGHASRTVSLEIGTGGVGLRKDGKLYTI